LATDSPDGLLWTTPVAAEAFRRYVAGELEAMHAGQQKPPVAYTVCVNTRVHPLLREALQGLEGFVDDIPVGVLISRNIPEHIPVLLMAQPDLSDLFEPYRRHD
jgi:hypothetical protein